MSSKQQKTNYRSVFTRQNRHGDTVFIIKYHLDGSGHTETVGKASESMTALKAAGILEDRKKSNATRIKDMLENKKYSFVQLSKIYFDNLYTEAASEEHLDYDQKSAKKVINIKKEESVYRNFWGKWILKKMKLSTIPEDKLKKFLLEQKKHYSDKSITNALAIAKSIIKHTEYEGEHPFNLKTDFKAKKMFKQKINPRKRFLSPKEVRKLLHEAKKKLSYQSRLMLLTSLLTGARPDSVLHLRSRDVNFNDHEITFFDFKREMYFTVPLPKSLGEELYDHVNRKCKFVFFSNVSKGIVTMSEIPREVQTLLNNLFNQYLLDDEEKVVVYTLRHTFANILLQVKKLPVADVSHLLNHASIQTTIKNYIHMNKDYIVGSDLSDLVEDADDEETNKEGDEDNDKKVS